jgi:monofunctional biosynthetic peptidoglycan transglycosylase
MLRRWLQRLVLLILGLILLVVGLAISMRWLNPPTSAFMIDARISALFAAEWNYRTHYQWVDLEDISPQAAIAVIASEDQLFPFHTGFDFKSIREAVRNNAKGRRVRGASTISQQVAKNLFLWPGGGYFRKGLEAALTLLIEVTWPKERILEVYLNIAQFGHGIYGVEAAAQTFYGRPAHRLNREQSAMLAAVLPNPQRFHVTAPTNYVLSRRGWILTQMAGLGGVHYLDELDAAQAATDQKRYPASSATARGGSTKP